MSFTRGALVILSVVGLCGCDDGPLNNSANTLRFNASAVIWQRNAGEVRSVFLVESLGGRLFAFITARGSDGGDAVFQSERVGSGWEIPFQLPRPGGATTERVEWALSAPTPVLVTVAAGGSVGAIYTREFNGASWMVPFAATAPGAETPSMVRVAAGSAESADRRTLHIAYATPTAGACANAMSLRHRVSFTLGAWQGADTVATACAPQDLALAAPHASGDPLVAVWTGDSLSGEREVQFAYSRTGVPAAFSPTQRIPLVQGVPAETRAVDVGAGQVLATWVQTGSPQRASYAVFDPSSAAWTAPDPNWFFTSLAPFLSESAYGTALLIASETDAPGARLMVRRWGSTARPIALSAVVRSPSGPITSPRVMTRTDNTVHAAWIENPGGGNVTQVWWASGADAVPDGGKGLDATP